MSAVICLSTQADEAPGKEKETSGLSLSFLEYLAELKQVDGKWMGPLDMQEAVPLKDSVENAAEADAPEEPNKNSKDKREEKK